MSAVLPHSPWRARVASIQLSRSSGACRLPPPIEDVLVKAIAKRGASVVAIARVKRNDG